MTSVSIFIRTLNHMRMNSIMMNIFHNNTSSYYLYDMEKPKKKYKVHSVVRQKVNTLQ